MTRKQKTAYWVITQLARAQSWIYRRILKERVWRSADGRVMLISEMTDSHLKNAIRMLRCRPHEQPAALDALDAEFRRRDWLDI